MAAEPSVYFVVEMVLDLVTKEARFLGGVSGQFEIMLAELRLIQGFLKDAGQRQEQGDNEVVPWIDGVREASYDVEDAIQTFVTKFGLIRKRRGPLKLLMRYSSVLEICIARRKVGAEIESITRRIFDLSTSATSYGTIAVSRDPESVSSWNERQRMLCHSDPHGEEEDIIGRDEELNIIVSCLVNEDL